MYDFLLWGGAPGGTENLFGGARAPQAPRSYAPATPYNGLLSIRGLLITQTILPRDWLSWTTLRKNYTHKGARL